MTDLELPITLRTPKWRMVVYLLGSLVFVAIGVWAYVVGGPLKVVAASSFFGLCSVVFVLQLLPNASYLQLTPDGFTYCALFRAHAVKWSDVEEFGVFQYKSHRMVVWNFKPDYPRTSRIGGSLSKSLSGYEAGLPDSYGLKVDQLAEFMEALRSRYTE